MTPYEDIDIVFTGLRPGEKLFEELLIDGEGVLSTSHQKIKVLAPVPIDIGAVRAELDSLYAAARSNRVDDLMESLRRLIPEFKPSYNFSGEVPATFQRVRPDLFPSILTAKARILPIRK